MEYLPGVCAGISQIIVGHPIDTVKVLIQNKMKYRGLSIKDYYRGCRLPMVTSIIFNSIIFPVHSYIYNLTSNHLLAGAGSGLAVTPFIFTLENIKIANQTKKKVNLSFLKSMNSFYTTTSREALAMSIYFTSYHKMRDHQYNVFLSGCVSGLLNWSITYPLDVIRSRQVIQNISFIQAYNQGNLCRGLHFALIRAVLVNGSVFYTYEKVNNWVGIQKP